MDDQNTELELAAAFIRHTGTNIFLTGKAGTGKTTFLKSIQQDCAKRLIVTAPTGVAAINAGGVTLHSFFQLPFGPYVPGSDSYSHDSRNRFSREKQGIIRSLDLLIIDEISMVRADMLDAVDVVLRRYRDNDAPFGGVQLLLIGDLQQLAPVVKENERAIIEQYYASPYFFSSNCLGSAGLVTIELEKIYRQTDRRFINLLNNVRDNRLDQETLQELNRRYQPEGHGSDCHGYVTLCTHNRQADRINNEHLSALPNPVHQFSATVEGDFPEHSFPTASSLELKLDAQVMFIRNDSSPEKRFYNGKIGSICRIGPEEVWIRCPDEEDPIVLEPSTWENFKYSLDAEKGEIRAEKMGSFSQYPLRLAWAMTIHKSQGLTFDKAIIDAQAAFTHGQVYVALSRCRSLEGVILRSPLLEKSVQTDPTVLDFVDQVRGTRPDHQLLAAEQRRYQQRLLLECFDFHRLRSLLLHYTRLLQQHAHQLVMVNGVDAAAMCRAVSEEICTVGENFQRQLHGLFQEDCPPVRDSVVLERLGKASVYFEERLTTLLLTPLERQQLDTDNKAIARQVARHLQRLQTMGREKLAAVISLRNGFSPTDYLRSIATVAMDQGQQQKKKSAYLYTEKEIAHPELFAQLKEWRTRTASEEGRPAYQVLHQKTLVQLAVHLPSTIDRLKEVKGIGDKLSQRYGEELVSLIKTYRSTHGIDAVQLPERQEPKKSTQSQMNTREQTLLLFEQGLTVSEIAEQRSLTKSTIEGHLAFWVAEEKINLDGLVAAEKRKQIEQAFQQQGTASFAAVKQRLGKDVSYGEIKLVYAHINGQCDKETEAGKEGAHER